MIPDTGDGAAFVSPEEEGSGDCDVASALAGGDAVRDDERGETKDEAEMSDATDAGGGDGCVIEGTCVIGTVRSRISSSSTKVWGARVSSSSAGGGAREGEETATASMTRWRSSGDTSGTS